MVPVSIVLASLAIIALLATRVLGLFSIICLMALAAVLGYGMMLDWAPRMRVATAQQIRPLLLEDKMLHRQCQAGRRDDRTTFAACDEHDALVRVIKANGWCWSQEDPADPPEVWAECAK